MLQWNPIKTVSIGPKKIGRINEGFFHKKMYGGFCQAAKKSGRKDEEAVLRRGGRNAEFHCNNQFPNKISAL